MSPSTVQGHELCGDDWAYIFQNGEGVLEKRVGNTGVGVFHGDFILTVTISLLFLKVYNEK